MTMRAVPRAAQRAAGTVAAKTGMLGGSGWVTVIVGRAGERWEGAEAAGAIVTMQVNAGHIDLH